MESFNRCFIFFSINLTGVENDFSQKKEKKRKGKKLHFRTIDFSSKKKIFIVQIVANSWRNIDSRRSRDKLKRRIDELMIHAARKAV